MLRIEWSGYPLYTHRQLYPFKIPLLSIAPSGRLQLFLMVMPFLLGLFSLRVVTASESCCLPSPQHPWSILCTLLTLPSGILSLKSH